MPELWSVNIDLVVTKLDCEGGDSAVSPVFKGGNLETEAIIAVPVSFRDISGRYKVCLYVDNDAATACGREIWGYPKKGARVSVIESAETVRYTVERGGVQIIGTSVVLADLAKPEEIPQPQPIINLKVIPSVRRGTPPDVKQLTVTTLENYKVKRAYKGNATVEFGMSPADPFHKIKVEEVVAGYYLLVDLDLTYGDVLYDYLDG